MRCSRDPLELLSVLPEREGHDAPLQMFRLSGNFCQFGPFDRRICTHAFSDYPYKQVAPPVVLYVLRYTGEPARANDPFPE